MNRADGRSRASPIRIYFTWTSCGLRCTEKKKVIVITVICLHQTLLQAQLNLATTICPMYSPTHTFSRKKGNKRQFIFKRKVIKTNNAALKALESGNVAKAKEQISQSIPLLNNRDKIVKLSEKSKFDCGLPFRNTLLLIWLSTRLTKAKKFKERLQKLNHYKRKRENLVLKIPFLRFHLLALLDVM